LKESTSAVREADCLSSRVSLKKTLLLWLFSLGLGRIEKLQTPNYAQISTHSIERKAIMELKIGYIGLGIMGKPMARNIIKAGYEVVVHNRSHQSVEELVGEGAIEANSPAEVAGQVDVVFTNLPDSPDVERVALGKDGIIDGAHAELIYVDNSTIKPATTRSIGVKLAEKGIAMLDAPVSGGDVGAIEGTLTIMVGGPGEALKTVRPVLESMSKTITHVGGLGDGQIAKAANQIMVAAQMVALGELLMLAQKAGAEPQKVVQAIRGGAAGCWTLDNKPQRLFAGNREPGFKAYMQAKDLGIVMDTAREFGIPLPAAAVHTQLFNAMLEMGMGELDNSAVLGVIEKMAGEALQA
jgi:2-hydroxy-3-oxopropionate reductase